MRHGRHTQGRHPHGRLGLLIAALIGAALPAHGVAIATGDGTGNTAPPADDFGFESVGAASGRTGLYLGNGWVLTAKHVSAQAITFLGQTYQPVAGSDVQLQNVAGDPPDLLVYRIDGAPPVAPVTLASVPPTAGEEVYCTGNGWNRAASSTQWNLDWEELPPYVYEGFERSSGRTLRWGRNLLSDVDVDVAIGSTATRSLETTFDAAGVPDEAQAWTGDSGGGCFAKRGGVWELVGVMFAQGLIDENGSLPPPPQPSGTAVFTNTTASADVFFYRDQIEALTPPLPPPVPGLSHHGVVALALALAAAWCVRRFAPTPRRR